MRVAALGDAARAGGKLAHCRVCGALQLAQASRAALNGSYSTDEMDALLPLEVKPSMPADKRVFDTDGKRLNLCLRSKVCWVAIVAR